MSPFRISTTKEEATESPAVLFRDLKKDPSIKFLWGHQEKLLDEYNQKHLATRNLAIELPTGTGKTLVGLLIGEFLRKSKGERVVFLCSTKQLCAQVDKQARKYGIATSLLIGKQTLYDPDLFYAYQRAKSIAITTYSGLFNSAPRISDPNAIICDDAHAAESFVPEMWTLRINRYQHQDLFLQLFSMLKGTLTDNAVFGIENQSNPRDYAVELVSPIAIEEQRNRLASTIDSHLETYPQLAHSWGRLKEHFAVCNMYCTSSHFEIRPILPPTQTHPPFSAARQRVYMSATLGEDGDLERCFGVRKIERMQVPEGWDRRGTGRRLILFPQLSQGTETAPGPLIEALIKENKRTVLLVPDDRRRDKICEELASIATVFTVVDTEDDIEKFRLHPGPAVLLLSNRYDGIDFPGEDCRCSIIVGFPAGAGLQETFLTQRLRAVSTTHDRVRTRVTQAMGRCTRDESDYSVVFVFSRELTKWFCTSENVRGMHPELQAEVAFGIENSTDSSNDRFLNLTRAFLARSSDWDGAEHNIRAKRNTLSRVSDEAAAALKKTTESEVEYMYSLWNGSFRQAYSIADMVVGNLSGGNDLRAYRCFWHHQASVAAYRAWIQNKENSFLRNAIAHLSKASDGGYGITWLSGLAAKLGGQNGETTASFSYVEWVEAIERLLSDLGLVGSKFDRRISEWRSFISDPSAKPFQQGLKFLGRMLGAIVHEWTTPGAPDGFWNFGFQRAFVFEAKTDEAPAGHLTLATIRQALTHVNNVRAEKLIPTVTPCTTVIISPRIVIASEARIHARELFWLSPGTALELFDKATSALRELRSVAITGGRGDIMKRAIDAYGHQGILPNDVFSVLTGNPVSSMKTPDDRG